MNVILFKLFKNVLGDLPLEIIHDNKSRFVGFDAIDVEPAHME